MPNRSSRCSAGGPLVFAYYPVKLTPSEDAIEAAAEEFEELMRRPGRRWSPTSWRLERRRFTRRLEAACAGGLEPVTHVKDIDRGAHEYLFEIRWDIGILEHRDGRDVHDTVPVRLYHAEPTTMTDVILGLHLHEKEIVDGDTDATNDLQDIEIDKAIKRFHDGRPVKWGIV